MIKRKHLVKVFEKWVDSMWQDESHPIDDEDVKNIFSDYLDHFSLHSGFEVIKQFTGEHLGKYVFRLNYKDGFDELISRQHILVRIKIVLPDSVGYEDVQDMDNRYCKKKYIDEASDLITDIANRIEDIGYLLRYPSIKIFSAPYGGIARNKEIVFRFTKIKKSNEGVNYKPSYYKRELRESFINKLHLEHPNFKIVHRGGLAYYYDIYYKTQGISGIGAWFRVGLYDGEKNNFLIFIGKSYSDYISKSHSHSSQPSLKLVPEVCIENTELSDGFERFVGIWDEVRDELK